ncbi:hypothetical protein PoB_002176400 [Plakobranchus ocellatus]|uniref:Uncharacterized protein n=1 Tax=Plakobranchus ocellatus TaxID=259542 RepID=A0AAV3ZN14_9GAST|nr:hypothetical protein PoB_002176400 [Plakobranchus ocellatus]
MQVNPSLDNGMEQMLTPVWDHGCVLFRHGEAVLILFFKTGALRWQRSHALILFLTYLRINGHYTLETYLLLRLIKTKSRFRVDRVNSATARQTLKQFWRPPSRLQIVFGGRYRDSRVFLAAAILTLESFWDRVVLACYTGKNSCDNGQTSGFA